jgi:predicted nuclease of predicted toxin-antitoxin system
MTKDSDFIRLLRDLGSPPQVIWLRCGNTSNANLKRILADKLPSAMEFLQLGELLVEIG